jgi:lysophospholipase L1-like esterase
MLTRATRLLGMIALCCAIGLVSLFATVVADRLLGKLKYPASVNGLLFPPHSRVSYETIDFSFTAIVNSLGFRDREFGVRKTAALRVLAIGDSYTYGWGVALEESWPKVLEANLVRNGTDVEVLNLGSPGASPANYADVAEAAIPLLRPDLVIVAMLQGDDLEQMARVSGGDGTVPDRKQELENFAQRTARLLYPNLLHFRRVLRSRGTPVYNVTSEWKHEAGTILAELDTAQIRRYRGLDAAVRTAFERGRLNPSLMHSALANPGMWLDTADPERMDVRRLEDSAALHLRRIKTTADRNGAKVIVVSVPMGHYVDRAVWEQRKGYGFIMMDKMLVDDAADVEIMKTAELAGLRAFTVTSQFRAQHDARLYFRFDTHLDVAGHRFFADQITPVISAELNARSR